MKIYEASTRRDVSVLVARQEDWTQLLSRFDDRATGTARRFQDGLRAKIVASLSGGQDIVRVTMVPDEARWILDRSRL